MTKKVVKKPQRPRGYPKLEIVRRGCTIIGQSKPDVIYLTVEAQLHNLGQQKTAALRQVFKIATQAAQWIVRDINQRKPVERFAKYRKRNSTSYNSNAIANEIMSAYRNKIRGSYTLNASIYTGLCAWLAANYASTLQKMAEAQKKGWLKRYQECAAFVVDFGKHRGKTLGELPRKSVFGFAFLQPKREQCERVVRFINAILNDLPEERELYKEAKTYRMEFGTRRGDKLEMMRPETLRRLRGLMLGYLARIEQIDRARAVAQDYLRFTPPGLPTVKSGTLSMHPRHELEVASLEALDAFVALPKNADDEEFTTTLTEDEHILFRELQRLSYEATNEPRYIPLQWTRGDGAVRSRDMALLYEAATRRYLFLAHILDTKSHFCTPLLVKGELADVNNPTVKLCSRERPSIANLYELEFSQHQRKVLDLACNQSDLWKEKGQYSGAVRSATLHAYCNEQSNRWWFEVHLAVGLKTSHYHQPQRVVGIHVDPFQGAFVCILNLDGSLHEQFHLDELRIAQLIDNRFPEQQAQLKPQQRTAKERGHRLTDALVAICEHHAAQL